VKIPINAKFPMRRTAASSGDMPACSMAKNTVLARTTLMMKRTNGFPLRAAATLANACMHACMQVRHWHTTRACGNGRLTIATQPSHPRARLVKSPQATPGMWAAIRMGAYLGVGKVACLELHPANRGLTLYQRLQIFPVILGNMRGLLARLQYGSQGLAPGGVSRHYGLQ